MIDDPVYVAYARQIQAHPSDPYGFDLYWYDAPEPAMRIGTVPAVLPYWLAGAMTIAGDSPFAWKLCLLPFALALTGSLGFLLDRFARPLTTPVLFTLALGPGVLPGFTRASRSALDSCSASRCRPNTPPSSIPRSRSSTRG